MSGWCVIRMGKDWSSVCRIDHTVFSLLIYAIELACGYPVMYCCVCLNKKQIRNFYSLPEMAVVKHILTHHLILTYLSLKAPLAKLKEYGRDGEAVLLYLQQCNTKLHTPSTFELDGLETLFYRLYKASKAVQAMIRMYAEASMRREQQNKNYECQEKEVRNNRIELGLGLAFLIAGKNIIA